MSLRGCQNSTNQPMETASFLVVRLGANYFALHASGVRGILRQEELAHDEAVTAVGNVHQPVDLARRLSIVADLTGLEGRTVLYSAGRSHGAIRVEQIVGLADVERKDCLPLPPQFQYDERNWFGGILLYQDQLALILNSSWVVGELPGVAPVSTRQADQLAETTPAVVGGSC